MHVINFPNYFPAQYNVSSVLDMYCDILIGIIHFLFSRVNMYVQYSAYTPINVNTLLHYRYGKCTCTVLI